MPSPLTVSVGSHTLDATPSLTHTGSAQAPSDQRRAKIPNRPSMRPCQATCRLPSGWAKTSWLNEGPSVVLTGSGSLQEPPENRQAQTPTRPSTDRPNSSQGVPSAVTAAVGRNRSSGPSPQSTTVDTFPSSAATSRSPHPSCHSSHPTSVVAPNVATLGRAALRLLNSTEAVPRACPTSRGAASRTAAAFSSWAGICPSPSSTHMYRRGSGSNAAMVPVMSMQSSSAAVSRWLNASTRSRSARWRSVYSPRWWSAAQPCACPWECEALMRRASSRRPRRFRRARAARRRSL